MLRRIWLTHCTSARSISQLPIAMIGQTITHYRIIEKIGSGGMGVVYKAEDLVLGRAIALKFLSEEYAHERNSVERFRREARAVSALNHPNICTVYEIGEADGQYFIAMELLSGRTLRSTLSNGALETGELLDLGIQIADALDGAHKEGIIHRDIKPENIYVTARKQIKILDFGLAKLSEVFYRMPEGVNASSLVTVDYESLSSSGTAVGTIAYMSPEQARGEMLDSRTDLFSFGAVLYEMASGRQAFVGKNAALVTDSILHANPALLPTVNPKIPAEFETIVNRRWKRR